MKNTVSTKVRSFVALLLLVATLLPTLTSCDFKFLFTQTEIVDGIENIPEGKMQISVTTDPNGLVCAYPYLSWTEEEGAEDYIVQLSLDEAFGQIFESKAVKIARYTVSTVLDYGTKYYVRVISRKNIDGKMVAISFAKSFFTTAAKHNTEGPDYSQTRMLFDFEDYTTESFNELFQMNAGGDDVTAEIVEGEGVNGSKALKLVSQKGDMGWGAMVCNLLPADKKVWTGSTGIRFHIRAEEGTSAEFSFRVGKRGYQTWAKQMSVKNYDGVYVTIPYEVMEDKGGGDGIWDLSIMTFMQFTFTGGGTLYIDDISIGSSEEYQHDTTANAANGIVPGILEDFEGDDADNALANGLSLYNVDATFTQLVDSADGGHELRFKTMSDSAFVSLNKAYYEINKYDYTQIDGITFKISLSHKKSGAQVMIKFGSYNNVYTANYDLSNVQVGEYVTVKIPISDLVLLDGSSGALNYNKIDTLQIFVKGCQYFYVTIDDIGFYND